MCAFMRAGAVCFALLSGTVLGAPPVAPPPAQPPRIVVAFANEPHTTPGPAGTTGSGQTIGILELSGGYSASDLSTYFKNLGLNKGDVWVR